MATQVSFLTVNGPRRQEDAPRSSGGVLFKRTETGVLYSLLKKS